MSGTVGPHKSLCREQIDSIPSSKGITTHTETHCLHFQVQARNNKQQNHGALLRPNICFSSKSCVHCLQLNNHLQPRTREREREHLSKPLQHREHLEREITFECASRSFDIENTLRERERSHLSVPLVCST